jgi:hypothetical protein
MPITQFLKFSSSLILTSQDSFSKALPLAIAAVEKTI